MALVDTAYEKALEVLRRCVSPLGFKASALAGGYPQVWARDAPITSLGALLTGDAELIACARASLETLSSKQTDLGMIHLNIDTRTGKVTTENAGAVDANSWFIIGHFCYLETTADKTFIRAQWPKLTQALLWLRYQDMNDCGLLEVPEAGDWADLYSVRYNVLYDNVLYAAALRMMAGLAEALGKASQGYLEQANDVARKLNLLLWLDRPWDGRVFGEQLESLKAMRLEWVLLYQNMATLTEAPYYLPWVGFREFGHTFDGFGNTLAVLTGVADAGKSQRILDYAHASGADHPYPFKAFSPPIYPGERDWREYFRSRNLNLPHQYHNGGIRPFLGGFYVAALVKGGRKVQAEAQLHLLAKAVQKGVHGEWEFNEWHHGVTGRPMGYPLQAWSAGLYVYAYHALCNEEIAFF